MGEVRTVACPTPPSRREQIGVRARPIRSCPSFEVACGRDENAPARWDAKDEGSSVRAGKAAPWRLLPAVF